MNDKKQLSMLENRILSLCAEDYIGVWEIFWYLKGHASKKNMDYFPLGLKIIRKLLSKGFVETFKNDKINKFDKLTEDLDKIIDFTNNHKKDILNDSNLNNLFWLGITKKGERFYIKQNKRIYSEKV